MTIKYEKGFHIRISVRYIYISDYSIITMSLDKFSGFVNLLQAYKTPNTSRICSLTDDIAERVSQLQYNNIYGFLYNQLYIVFSLHTS